MKKVLKVLLIILLILILIVAGGFAYLYFNGMSGMSNTTEAKGGQIKVACAGDSTTYGHGISNWPRNNYPTVLQNLLGDGYHVNNYWSALCKLPGQWRPRPRCWGGHRPWRTTRDAGQSKHECRSAYIPAQRLLPG